MSFIPLVAESIGALGTFVGESTGSQIAGAAVAGAVSKEVNKAVENVAGSVVNSIFGAGTFENLEQRINDLYSTSKKLNETINEVKSSGRVSTKQINQLEAEKAAFNKDALVQGTEQFVKDLSYLVSQGDFNVLDSPNNLSIENNNRTVSNILNTLSKVNPFYSYLATKFSDKLSDFTVPTDQEYLKVASVYNGQGISDMTAEQTFNGFDFVIIDEIGKKNVWKFPSFNDYTVITPIFGVYTGISSPNDALVLNGSINGKPVQSYLDRIAALHDIGYHDLGSFNKFSDYQLISRAVYGKQNNLYIFPGEEAAANVAISYFSTLGSAIRKMFGSDDNVTENLGNEKPLILDIINDIYNVQIDAAEAIDIKQEIAQNIKNSSVPYGSETVVGANFELRNLLNNLEIELS